MTKPVSEGAILATLEAMLGNASIAESKRIEFFEGRRKLADGTTKRQATNTGNIAGKAPILASGGQSTAEGLKPSPASTGGGQTDTKPVSVAEALSLWQTACFDLQSYGFKIAILAQDNRVFMLLAPPASIGSVSFSEGHLRIDGKPVSEL